MATQATHCEIAKIVITKGKSHAIETLQRAVLLSATSIVSSLHVPPIVVELLKKEYYTE